MSEKSTREQIVEAADRLFYERGFEHTSFADIADVVRISRGNFYHHFKSKDEMLRAVIEARVASTRQLLASWEAASDRPADRIRSYIGILVAHRAPSMRYGCPVGVMANAFNDERFIRREARMLNAWLARYCPELEEIHE